MCGTKMIVEKAIPYPTHFGHALGAKWDLHDIHECPHRDEEWHQTARSLVEEIEETPSKSMAKILKNDLDDILRENGKL